jgi:anti-sigma regulatory factor (Ser/Thr protein kinase)
MRSRRRGPLLVAAIGLLVLVVMVSLVLAAIAGPVLVVVSLAVIALVAGLASRLAPPSRRRHTADEPHLLPQDNAPNVKQSTGTAASGPRWGMKWESCPPASAVPFARDQLTQVLAGWGLTGEAVEPTQLVVTELLSNAIDHARAPIRLTVSFPGEWVRVEVHDATDEPPRQQSHDPWRLRGRGLQMVDGLAVQWGWTADAAGKTVWADVPIGWPPG